MLSYRLGMIGIFLIILVSLISCAAEDIDEKFLWKLDAIRTEFRRDLAKEILSADKVELSVVKFDALSKGGFVNKSETIAIHIGGKRCEVLQKKNLLEKEKSSVLKALTTQLVNPKAENSVFCHYPIHGLKVWKKDKLVFESSFCWVCNNFYLELPRGYIELATTEEMKSVFNKLLPIPKSEMERFKKKYPGMVKEK